MHATFKFDSFITLKKRRKHSNNICHPKTRKPMKKSFLLEEKGGATRDGRSTYNPKKLRKLLE
jgi:hypothetical protein